MRCSDASLSDLMTGVNCTVISLTPPGPGSRWLYNRVRPKTIRSHTHCDLQTPRPPYPLAVFLCNKRGISMAAQVKWKQSINQNIVLLVVALLTMGLGEYYGDRLQYIFWFGFGLTILACGSVIACLIPYTIEYWSRKMKKHRKNQKAAR